MSKRPAFILLTLLLLPACVVTAGQPTAPKPGASTRTAAIAASPTTKPVAMGSVKAVPTLLARPTGNVSVLSGQITLDANYIVAQGGGNIVAQGAGNLIGNDGGSLITNDGAGLAVDSGNAIISNDGGSLITNDGGGLIGNDGGGLIGNDGAGVVAQGAGNYALTATSEVPVGQLLPVAGAQVAVRSLITGKLLPLGKGPDGQDVTTIVSNRQGKFEVYLPASEVNNVRVETAFHAGSSVQSYRALTLASAGSVAVDEDTQLVAEFATQAFADRLQDFITTKPEDLAANRTLSPFKDLMAPFQAAAAKLSDEQLKVACRRGAELMIARPTSLTHEPVYDLVDADGTRVASARARNEARGLKTSRDVLADLFHTVRRAVVARMRKQDQPLAYFDNLPQVVAYRTLLNPSFHVTRAADVPRFLVRAYLSSPLKDPSGFSASELARAMGLAGFLEGGKPASPPLAARWLPLFPADLTPNSPPALSTLATGADNLGADALEPNEAYRSSSGTRAINAALIEVLFLQGEPSEQLQAQLLALLK